MKLSNKSLDKLITTIRRENGYEDKACVINFRDPNYSAVEGGFHPVEIMVHANGEYSYITDFSYMGIGAYAELEKEIDWDFGEELCYHMGRPYKLQETAELFAIWVNNFLTYYHMGVFKVEVTEA